MQVPVEIKLKTVQTQAGEIEKFELLEQGELTCKGETIYLRYTEAKAGAQTILKIKPAELLLTRRQGQLALQLNLVKGQQTNAKYKTAYVESDCPCSWSVSFSLSNSRRRFSTV